MKISYGITCCNEYIELQTLVKAILLFKNHTDEVVILQDLDNGSSDVTKFCLELAEQNKIKFIQASLNKDFANFKNTLKDICKGDFMFQIDADEVPHTQLIANLPQIITLNPEIDMYKVPRINIVRDIAPAHLHQWRWTINDKKHINWPDCQTRILRNHPKIKWVGKVHEVLSGFDKYATLPLEEEYCLYHVKEIKKQCHQNDFYSKIL